MSPRDVVPNSGDDRKKSPTSPSEPQTDSCSAAAERRRRLTMDGAQRLGRRDDRDVGNAAPCAPRHVSDSGRAVGPAATEQAAWTPPGDRDDGIGDAGPVTAGEPADIEDGRQAALRSQAGHPPQDAGGSLSPGLVPPTAVGEQVAQAATTQHQAGAAGDAAQLDAAPRGVTQWRVNTDAPVPPPAQGYATVLAAGVDSLYLAVRGVLSDVAVDALTEIAHEAEITNEPVIVTFPRDIQLAV